MYVRQTRQPGRGGFTLVEILIVIVIIIILASFISAAVVKALGKAREVRNRAEISQLSAAVENFKSKFGFYPPSRLILCEVYSQYNQVPAADSQLAADSVQFITRMFPQCVPQWQNPGIDWDGNNSVSAPVKLQGDQCLVFFLGGLQAQAGGGLPPACLGFSTNPRNPADSTTSDRIGPLFEFVPNRLVIGYKNRPIHSEAAFYHAYVDIFGSTDGFGTILQRADVDLPDGQPYAYFSSYKTTNGYNRYIQNYNSSDCVNLEVWPYYDGPGRYLNPNSFQIISAGANRVFGPGGVPGPAANPWLNAWTPTTASQFYADGPAVGPAATPGGKGRDDQSNFYDTLLGAETR